MSVVIAPPRTREGEIDVKLLRAAALGRDDRFPRAKAIEMLGDLRRPDTEDLLGSILEDDHTPSRFRYVAAMGLAALGSKAGMDHLIRNIGAGDDQVRVGIVKALARVGDESALRAIENVPRGAPEGLVDRQARFASVVVAHRLGIRGHDLPPASSMQYVDLPPAMARPVEMRPAGQEEFDEMAASMDRAVFGVELTAAAAYRLRCADRDLAIFLDRSLTTADGIGRLGRAKAVAGVIATKNESTRRYSPWLLVLCSPREDAETVDVVAYTDDGQAVLGGEGSSAPEEFSFSLRSVMRPGAFGLTLDGRLSSEEVRFDRAESAIFVEQRRTPSKGFPRRG